MATRRLKHQHGSMTSLLLFSIYWLPTRYNAALMPCCWTLARDTSDCALDAALLYHDVKRLPVVNRPIMLHIE